MQSWRLISRLRAGPVTCEIAAIWGTSGLLSLTITEYSLLRCPQSTLSRPFAISHSFQLFYLKCLCFSFFCDYNWNYLYLQVSPSSHSNSCFVPCRPFVVLTTLSTGLVGCRECRYDDERPIGKKTTV